MDPGSPIGICPETGRWVIGVASVALGLAAVVVLWSIGVYREAVRRLEEARRHEPAPPPTWRSRRELVARGRVRVPPVDERVDFFEDDSPPATPRRP